MPRVLDDRRPAEVELIAGEDEADAMKASMLDQATMPCVRSSVREHGSAPVIEPSKAGMT
jgi:hypothetical protein